MTKLFKQFNIYNPATKRALLKNISGDSMEEIDMKGKIWKAEMKILMDEKAKQLKEKKEPEPLKAIIEDKEFNLVMPPADTGGCSILMLGSGRAGKTYALKHIMDKYFKSFCGMLFSMSANASAYQNMKYPLIPLCDKFIPEIMNEAYLINKGTKNNYDFLFVLDDCPLARYDKELLKLLTIYRNTSLSGICCIQSPTLLNPTCRSNFTFTMLFKQNTTEQIEQTIKFWLRGYFPKSWNMEEKIAWYKSSTDDHHFIFIDNWNGTIQRCRISE